MADGNFVGQNGCNEIRQVVQIQIMPRVDAEPEFARALRGGDKFLQAQRSSGSGSGSAAASLA